MRTQETIMREAGFVTAADAARAVGADNVGTIHRAVRTKRLKGARAGNHWYVSVASLMHEYRDASPLMERIRALGVEPNPEHEKEIAAGSNGIATAPKQRRRKRSSRTER